MQLTLNVQKPTDQAYFQKKPGIGIKRYIQFT